MKLSNVSEKVYPDNFHLSYYFIFAQVAPRTRFQFASKWSSNQNKILRAKHSIKGGIQNEHLQN